MFIGNDIQPLFILALVTLLAASSKGNRNPRGCTSPCQHASSDTSGNTDLLSCEISRCNLSPLSLEQAPSAPRNVVLEASSEQASDHLTYLSISPHWQAPLENIDLLTGFEVKTICNKSPCVSLEYCFVMTFNRNITTADALTNFSMNCLFGNFLQPEMEYVTIVRSLPQNKEGSNWAKNRMTLPDCKEEEDVSLCKVDSYEMWTPYAKPLLELEEEDSIRLNAYAGRAAGGYPDYLVTLDKVDRSGILLGQWTKTLQRGEDPIVRFYNITPGRYFGYVQINSSICRDCPQFRSKLLIVPEAPRVTVPPQYSVQVFNSAREPDALPVAGLAGALGSFLGICLLVAIGYLTYKQCQNSRDNRGEGFDDTEDDDFGYGSNHIFNNFLHSTDDGNRNGVIGIDNPSMVPQTIHTDLSKPNGILQQESINYANFVGREKGDSVSTAGLDARSFYSFLIPAQPISSSVEPRNVRAASPGEPVYEDNQEPVLSLEALNEVPGVNV